MYCRYVSLKRSLLSNRSVRGVECEISTYFDSTYWKNFSIVRINILYNYWSFRRLNDLHVVWELDLAIREIDDKCVEGGSGLMSIFPQAAKCKTKCFI